MYLLLFGQAQDLPLHLILYYRVARGDFHLNFRASYGWGPTNYRLLAEANLLEAYALQSIMQLGRCDENLNKSPGAAKVVLELC